MTASKISLGKNYKSHIALNDTKDFYKFTLNSNCKLKINLKTHFNRPRYYIYDSNGYEIYGKVDNFWNESSQIFNTTIYLNLNKGTYYLGIFAIGDYKLESEETVKWTSSNNNVATVNSKGVVYSKRAGSTVIKAVVGNKVTATCTVYIKPDTFKILKIKSGALVNKRRRTVVVYWQKLSDISGYNVYYSTSRYGKYKKADYYFLIDTWNHRDYKLKRHKTYYFKMRASKSAGRKVLYGNFSKVKKIRVK